MRRTMAENILFADAAYAGPKTTGLIGRQSRMSEGQKVKPLFIDVDHRSCPTCHGRDTFNIIPFDMMLYKSALCVSIEETQYAISLS